MKYNTYYSENTNFSVKTKLNVLFILEGLIQVNYNIRAKISSSSFTIQISKGLFQIVKINGNFLGKHTNFHDK